MAEPTTQTALRIPDRIIEGVDKYAKVMRQSLPGASIKRADSIRALLLLGLAVKGIAVGPAGEAV